MQKVTFALILLSIGIIAAPVIWVAVTYQGNFIGFASPLQFSQLIGSTTINSATILPPQLVNATYDETAKTFTIVFNFTNPLNLNLTLNALSTDLTCKADNATLGHVQLAHPVKIDKDTTVDITIVCSWTAQAENHIPTYHAQQDSIPVALTNMVVDVSGVTIKMPTSYDIGNIPIP
jgi:hypothetical protein